MERINGISRVRHNDAWQSARSAMTVAASGLTFTQEQEADGASQERKETVCSTVAEYDAIGRSA